MSVKIFAKVSWCWEDVKELKPHWGQKRCEEFLERHNDHIRDNAIQDGWDTLQAYLGEEDDQKKKKKVMKLVDSPLDNKKKEVGECQK